MGNSSSQVVITDSKEVEETSSNPRYGGGISLLQELNAYMHFRSVRFTGLEKKPPIMFLDFEIFKSAGMMPQFDENNLTPLSKIDRDNSLIIFVSHTWLRNIYEAEGYEKRRRHGDVES